MYELKSFVLIIFSNLNGTVNFLSLSISQEKMAQFDIGAYLTKEFYDKVVVGEDKSYIFSNSPDVKYRLATIDSNSISFKVLVDGNFKLVCPKKFNEKAVAPMLVLLEVDPVSVSPFSLLQDSLEEKMGCQLNSSYANQVYLNTDMQVFKHLQAILADGVKPDLIFTITLRHILMRSEGMPRMKFILAAADKRSAAKRSGATKKVAAKKSKQVVNNETKQCKEDPAPQVDLDHQLNEIFRELE
jgi:hypothetical protein